MIHIIGIFNTVQSSEVTLRQRIIEGVSTVLEFQTDIVMTHLEKVCQLMLSALNERD